MHGSHRYEDTGNTTNFQQLMHSIITTGFMRAQAAQYNAVSPRGGVFTISFRDTRGAILLEYLKFTFEIPTTVRSAGTTLVSDSMANHSYILLLPLAGL